MRYAPELASGPWPCYVVDFDELAAVLTATGVGVESDGQAVAPKPEAIDRVIDSMSARHEAVDR